MISRSVVVAACLAAGATAFAQTRERAQGLYGAEAVDIDGGLGGEAFSLGLISQSEGALPPDLWAGSDQTVIETLLARAPTGAASPAMNDLLRRVLLSGGRAPSDWRLDAGLTELRLDLLVKTGHAEEARILISLVPSLETDATASKAAAQADLLHGDDRQACLRGQSVEAARSSAFWLKLRAYCHAVSDAGPAAELTLALAREEGVLDANADLLLSALAIGGDAAGATVSDALEYAAARALEAPLDEAALYDAPPGVLRAVALDEGASENTRFYAAAPARLAGALTADELRDVLGASPFAASAVARAFEVASVDASLHGDALIYRAVRETLPGQKADAIARALVWRLTGKSENVDPGVDFRARLVMSALYADEIDTIVIHPHYAKYAPVFASALVAAGRYELAAHWIRLADTGEAPERFIPLDEYGEDAAEQPEDDPLEDGDAREVEAAAPLGDYEAPDPWALESARILLKIAAPEAAGDVDDVDWPARFELAEARGLDGVIFRDAEVALASALDSTPAERLAAYMAAQSSDYDELTRPLAEERGEITGAASEPDALYGTSASVLRALVANAAREKRRGETALGVLASLDRSGHQVAPIGAVVDAIAHLKAAGLDAAARALAFEAIWARQIAFETFDSEVAASEGESD